MTDSNYRSAVEFNIVCICCVFMAHTYTMQHTKQYLLTFRCHFTIEKKHRIQINMYAKSRVARCSSNDNDESLICVHIYFELNTQNHFLFLQFVSKIIGCNFFPSISFSVEHFRFYLNSNKAYL